MRISVEKSTVPPQPTAARHYSSYTDKWLLILGIPIWGFLLRHIGEPEPLSQLLEARQYYVDLLYALAVIACIWLLNRRLILLLDRKYSWITHTFQRFFIQSVLAYGLTFLFMLLVSFIYNEFLINRAPVFNLNNVFAADIPTSLLFATITHLIYTGMWMVQYHKQTMEQLEQKLAYVKYHAETTNTWTSAEEVHNRTMLVNQGKGLIPLPVEHVAYIFIANEVSMVRSLSGQSYTVDGTLEQLLELLPAQRFFRISRQFIVQRSAIKKVDNETSGRLLLHLQPEHSVEVIVSRRRATDFRHWLES